MGMEEMLKYLDALYANGDHNTAETHLLSWIEEAGMSGARLDLLTLYSELEGLYRVTNRVGQAVDLAERALALIDELGLTHTRHHVTALINCATSLVVQGNTDKALEMFRLALVLIKELGQQETYQAAALYNNISHCRREIMCKRCATWSRPWSWSCPFRIPSRKLPPQRPPSLCA